MRCAGFLSGLLLLPLAAGCGKSSPNNAEQADGGAPAVAAQDEGPEAAVARFLTAVRAGDDERASAMLTPIARAKTAENNMVVAPPGSDTASFKVGEVEMIGDDGAHVASFWTDLDENGDEHTDTIIWMVRKEPQGWRIAGMATRVFEDKPAVILNFEEPDDMLAKQQEIEQEMSRRAAAEEAPAEEPEHVEATADTRVEVREHPLRKR